MGLYNGARPALSVAMKTRSLLSLLLGALSATLALAQDPPPAAVSSGVVEAVEISGISSDQLSQQLRDDLQALRGMAYNAEAASQLADRIQTELPEYVAAVRTIAGTQPGQVRVAFVVARISDDDALGENINARYPVESVILEGIPQTQISKALWDEIQRMAGQPLNEETAERHLQSLRGELGSRYEVSRKVRRGKPRQLTVVYEVVKTPMLRWIGPRSLLAYQTKQGITAFGHATFDVSESESNARIKGRIGFGTNADDFVERYKGYRLQVETQNVVSERMGFRLDFTAFGTKWKSQTLLAAEQAPAANEIYRSRMGLAPEVAFALTPDLYVTAGLALTRLEIQMPVRGSEWVKAGTGGLQFQKTIRSGDVRHQLLAGYSVHTADPSLGSAFTYTRHFIDGVYVHRRNKAMLRLDVRGGRISGNAPLFERFSIGNTDTARGWNKFDIAPLGTSRMSHASFEVGKSAVRLFYDVGSVWNRGESARARHSLGLTFGTGDQRGEGALTIAFAMRNSRLEPTIMFRLWGR